MNAPYFWLGAQAEETSRVLIADIQRRVAAHYAVPMNAMLSQRRDPRIVLSRHVAMYLSRQLTARSYPEIARLFRRDHTTVMDGCRHIALKILDDERLDEAVATLAREINA